MMKHGRTLEHDAEYNEEDQMVKAARALLDKWEFEGAGYEGFVKKTCPKGWDIDIWRKMLSKPYKKRLVIAGALIAAEIDRLDGLTSQDLLNNLVEGLDDEHQA